MYKCPYPHSAIDRQKEFAGKIFIVCILYKEKADAWSFFHVSAFILQFHLIVGFFILFIFADKHKRGDEIVFIIPRAR